MKFKTSGVIGIIFFALMITGCGGGGGGGGGGDTSGGGTTPTPTTPTTIENSNMIMASGLINGGASLSATQTLTGVLPNPGGSSAATFEGKAYLVLNGNRIPLNVTTSDVVETPDPAIDPNADLDEKDGKSGFFRFLKTIKSYLPALKASGEEAAKESVYSVTFSLNAGSNTLAIEVYDLNNTLRARSETWRTVGAIQPTSLVVTLWWDTSGTDIDLHMSPDDGATHCSYQNHSAGQMVLDYDNTSGYGPEHITIDNATGSNTYKIKVYYYADHNTNDPPEITPTAAHVTATINGEVKLDVIDTLSSASTSSGWTSGAHVWDAGEVEVNAPNRYIVSMDDPDLSSYPNVGLTVTVTDPGNTVDPKVTGLSSSNFYVINAGKAMSPVRVSAAENVYTLSFNDILAGKRDIYVYALKPAEGENPMKAGLSATKTYGNNYALLVGLNEYPPRSVTQANWVNDATPATQFTLDVWTKKKPNPATGFTVDAADFVTTMTDAAGGTNSAPVDISPSAVSAPAWDAAQKKYKYTLTYANLPANYADYDGITQTTFKKASWLAQCLNDVTDMNNTLLAKGTGMSNTSWDAANITTYLNSNATKDNILGRIEAIAGAMQKYDLFLFHFSGHGSGMPAAGNAAQYLCAYEDGKWISVNDLKAKLDLIPNASGGITNAIVLLDACHTGNFINKSLYQYLPDDENIIVKYQPFIQQVNETPGTLKAFSQIRDLTGMTNVYVMAGQTGSSFSYDDGNLHNGVFTYYLVEGINVSAKAVSAALANTDHSPVVSAEEAFAYLEPKVAAWVAPAHGYDAAAFQHPQVLDNSTSTATFLIYNW
jgi:hypothetical protein